LYVFSLFDSQRITLVLIRDLSDTTDLLLKVFLFDASMTLINDLRNSGNKQRCLVVPNSCNDTSRGQLNNLVSVWRRTNQFMV